MQEMQVRSLSWEDTLEEEMATHSRFLPWIEEPGRLQFMGPQRVRHDGACTHAGRAISSCPSAHVQLQLATEYACEPPRTWTDMDSKCPSSSISGMQRETTCPKPEPPVSSSSGSLQPPCTYYSAERESPAAPFDSHLQAFLHSHSHFCEPQLLASLLPFYLN